MSNKKGFTLLEIIVVLIIIGVLVAVIVPNFINYTFQGAAKAAQNNLISIYKAEKTFYFTNGYFCSTSTQNATCGNNLANINTNLSLNINDTNFTYSCTDPNSASDSNSGTSFSCTATNVSDANLYLKILGGTASSPTAIIMPGATNCSAYPWNAPCNPSCTTDNSNYCPNS